MLSACAELVWGWRYYGGVSGVWSALLLGTRVRLALCLCRWLLPEWWYAVMVRTAERSFGVTREESILEMAESDGLLHARYLREMWALTYRVAGVAEAGVGEE